MTPRHALTAVTLTAVLLAPAAARADKATEAGFHFKRGMELVAKRQYEAALDAFFRSDRLSPNRSVVFNIARCLELLGHLDEAFSYYSGFSASATEERDRADVVAALERILPDVARLRVETAPPGATIWLDRKELGEIGSTPRLLAAPEGEHVLLVELEGYRPASRDVVLRKGALAEARLELVRIVGTLAVTSEPSGATVQDADGDVLGVAPLEVRLPPGEHELLLTLEGRQETLARATVVADGRAELSVTLEPLPPPTGRLTVTSNLPGSLVWLDDKTAGFTPAVLDAVVVGVHTLEVSREGFRTWRETVRIEEDEPQWAGVTLEPKEQATGRGPWPWVFLATAGTAAAAGAVFGVLSLGTHRDFEADPTAEALQRGERLNLAADVLYASAGILGVASAALFLLTEPQEERQSTGHLTGGALEP